MHSHNIALAVADARVGDLQRVATDSAATVAPRGHRRHRRALALLGLAATAVLAALAPTGALAQPLHDAATLANAHVDEAPAPRPAQDLRALAKTSSLAGTTARVVKAGDTPVDDPGGSRAPEYTAPSTIQVVRPERTIVRDVDEPLPIVLSSAALLVALGGCAFLLLASIRRRRLGSSH